MSLLRHTLPFLLAFLALFPVSRAGGAEGVPGRREQISLSFAPVVRTAAPAVVNVFTRTVQRERPLAPFMDDPLFRRFFGEDQPFGMPRQRMQNSLGSGVIVKGDGLIITNEHVVRGAVQITVVLSDRREFDATVVTADSRVDLALLKVDSRGETLPALELMDSDTVEVGDLVLAIGNPFGVGQTVTSGIVSAVGRSAAGVNDYGFFIQTDAAINPGNSGGPLVGMDGRIVGINTAIYSRSGGSIGIGFAIPANMVRAVLDARTSGGRVVRGWLGVTGQRVSADIAASLGMPRPTGVLVKGVDARAPVAQAGLRVGDVILSVNGHVVDDPDALRFHIATQPVNSRITLQTQRVGTPREVAFALSPPPETPPREATPIKGRNPFSGATVANLSPALAEEIGFAGPPQGVVVLQVEPSGIARNVGLQAGDVVLRLNDRDIGDVAGLIQTLRSGGGGAWVLSIRRGDKVLTTTVRG